MRAIPVASLLLVSVICITYIARSAVYNNCGGIRQLAIEKAYEAAHARVRQCIALADTLPGGSGYVLGLDAWALFGMERYEEAVSAQEAANFYLQGDGDGDEIRGFLQLSLYAYKASRLPLAIRSAQAARKIAISNGGTTMPIQYHLGRALRAAGRHNEAIAALSEGIPFQPLYPFAYWERALAYEETQDSRAAEQDLEVVAHLLQSEAEREEIDEPFLRNVEAKLDEYEIPIQWPMHKVVR